MKNSREEIHVGELIKSKCKDLRVGPTELGTRIETSKQNVYGIFKRQSIDSELLAKISKALAYDFFNELSQAHFGNSKWIGQAKRPGKMEQHPHLESEPVERENAYLRRINMLLEEKLASLEKQLRAKSNS